jgi:hypothetical protein
MSSWLNVNAWVNYESRNFPAGKNDVQAAQDVVYSRHNWECNTPFAAFWEGLVGN